jgi:hypothetical protein
VNFTGLQDNLSFTAMEPQNEYGRQDWRGKVYEIDKAKEERNGIRNKLLSAGDKSVHSWIFGFVPVRAGR